MFRRPDILLGSQLGVPFLYLNLLDTVTGDPVTYQVIIQLVLH